MQKRTPAEAGALSESALHAHFEATGLGSPPRVLIGPGDDMAMLALDATVLLAAVDQVVEGRHFLPGTDEALIAHKALARNLSDVAAMATRPVAILAACTLPADWSQSRAKRLFDALRLEALAWQCPLIGGDLAVHAGREPLMLAVTILSAPWPESAPTGVVRRRAARIGDGVFVTGRLGGSFGHDGMGRHLRVEPRVFEARHLLRSLGDRLHAMIDVSDGLGRDSAQLVGDEGQVVLDAARIPCSSGCDVLAALGDGEDHELCFAAAGDPPRELEGRDGARVEVTRIGEVRRRPAGVATACVVVMDGREVDASASGWEHRGHGG